MNLDSRELRNCIKKLKVEDGEVDNSGLVNSFMYLREAGHFSNKGLHLTAASNLTIGKQYTISQLLEISHLRYYAEL